MSTEECPLCGRGCRSPDHTRQHLHTDHRKAEIIDAYIGEREEGREVIAVETG
ncbi:MAG: hypothetical protein ABEH77_03115 [Halobacteriaceae archaeon]